MTRYLIYGGTFDPPHIGHVQVPQAAMLHLGFDQVIYVPANISPLKTDTPPTSIEHRLAMLELALQDHTWANISKVEIDRGGTSYTIDTLETLLSTVAECNEMRLLIGADQWEQFQSWHRWEEILALADPAVMPRLGSSLRDDRILPIDPLPATSTDIRELVHTGKPIDHLVCPQIAAYIAQHNLYR